MSNHQGEEMKILKTIVAIASALLIAYILVGAYKVGMNAGKLIQFRKNTVGAILEHDTKPMQFSLGKSDPVPEFTASKKLEQKMNDQTVSIISMGRGMGSCSGTIIYEDQRNHYVLSAKHCVGVHEEVYVEHTKILYTITSADDDLALIVVDGKIRDKSVAILGRWSAFVGEDVHHFAYPHKVIYKASGKVTYQSDDWEYYDFKSIGGCSGGGIFNRDGDLISVLWGGYDFAPKDAPMKSIGEPLRDIKTFLYTIGLGDIFLF